MTTSHCKYDLTCRNPQCTRLHSDSWRAHHTFFPVDITQTNHQLQEHPINSGPRWSLRKPDENDHLLPPLQATSLEAQDPSRVILAIDPPQTLLHDDAFEVHLDEETRIFTVRTHIVNVMDIFLSPELSATRDYAHHVMENTYGTNHSLKLFPRSVGERYSFQVGVPRSAVTLTERYQVGKDAKGDTTFRLLEEGRFSIEVVSVTHFLTYEDAVNRLLRPETDPVGKKLKQAYKFACGLEGLPANAVGPCPVKTELRLERQGVDAVFEYMRHPSSVIIPALLSRYNTVATMILLQHGHAKDMLLCVPSARLTRERVERAGDIIRQLYPTRAEGGVVPPPNSRQALHQHLRQNTNGIVSFEDILLAFGICQDSSSRYVVAAKYFEERKMRKEGGGAEESGDDGVYALKCTHPLRSYLCAYHQQLLVHTVCDIGGSTPPPYLIQESIETLCADTNVVKGLTDSYEDAKFWALVNTLERKSLDAFMVLPAMVTRRDDRRRVVTLFIPHIPAHSKTEKSALAQYINNQRLCEVSVMGDTACLAGMGPGSIVNVWLPLHVSPKKKGVKAAVPTMVVPPECLPKAMRTKFEFFKPARVVNHLISSVVKISHEIDLSDVVRRNT